MTFEPSASHGAGQADGWATISNELLQGLIHALNNRVAALGALVELARLDAQEAAESLEGLTGELAQLGRVNALFALLPDRHSEAEALELPDLLDEALALHAHHPRLRNQTCSVSYAGTVLPVRAPRWALLHALVMLVHVAKRAAESVQDRGGVPLLVEANEDWVVVRVRQTIEPPPDLAALAVRCGAELDREGDAIALRLPTLLELRRRRRDGGAGDPAR
jgi:C4-dicarboxylate-specific signal transduction histidine kinase